MNRRRAGILLIHELDGRILLVRHPKSELWFDTGGKIEGDESPVAAAKREVLEEVGIQIYHPVFLAQRTYPAELEESMFEEDMFYAFTTQTPHANGEIVEAKWFTYEQTQQLPLMKSTSKFIEKVVAHLLH